MPVLLCGPLLHRLGEAFIPDLGGCRIGERPINYHLDVLRQFGAEIEKRQDGLRLTAPRGLHAADIHLPFPSVGATEQVLLTAVRARGLTTRNAAIEPEITDLIAILQKMGALISVQTDRVITVEGVDRLGGFDHLAIPDRIEAGSWACAALATGGDVYVRGAQAADDAVPQRVPPDRGAFDVDDEGIRFWHRAPSTRSRSRPTSTGFMTDWQQPLVVALTQTTGLSIVHETVYENRLGFTEAPALGRPHPDLPRVPRRLAVPVRARQLPALGRDLGPPRSSVGDHRARPARRLRLRHRRAGGARPVQGCTASTSSTAATSASRRDKLGPSAPPPSSVTLRRRSADGLARPDADDPHPVAARPASSTRCSPAAPRAGGAARSRSPPPGGRTTSTPSSSSAEPEPSSSMRWMVAAQNGR